MKKRKHNKAIGPAPHAAHREVPAPPKQARRRWPLLLVCLVAAAAATYFVLTAFLWAKLPDAIVGTWRAEDGELQGSKVTFYRDGTFHVRMDIEGQEVLVEAHVELRDKTLRYTIPNALTKRNDVKSQSIQSLTADEMVLVEKGITSRLVRIK